MSSSQEPQLVTVGHITNDTYVTPTGQAETTIGGGAGLPAVAAASVLSSEKIGLIAKIGDDEFGQMALKLLKRIGLNTQGVEEIQNALTAWVSILELSNNQRQIDVNPGVATDGQLHFPDSYLKAQLVHIGSGPAIQQWQWLQQVRQLFSPETKISVDLLEIFIPEQIHAVMKLIAETDLLMLNQTEYNLIRAQGGQIDAGPTILKQGGKGLIYLEKGEVCFTLPAPRVKNVIHTGGAGEVIAGVFLGLRAQGMEIRPALEKAVQLASFTVTDFGIQPLIDLILASPPPTGGDE